MSLNKASSYEWNITNPSLIKQIKNAKNGKQFVSDTFELCSLNWRIEINPNGCSKERTGSFDVFLKLMSISTKWKNVTINRTIVSPETSSSFTTIDTYTTKGESSGWPINTLTLKEIKNTNLKQITFIITIQVIQIKLKKNDSIYYHYDFKYQKVQKITCKLATNTLNKLKKSNIGKRWTTKIYNNMWAVQIYPNGNNKSGSGTCIIALILCALPANRSKIRIQWNLMVNELNVRQNQFKEFSLTKYGATIRVGSFEDFKKCIAFTISINILIVTEYDNNGRDIFNVSKNLLQSAHANHIRSRTFNESYETKEDMNMEMRSMDNKQYIDDKLAVYDIKMNALSTRIDELIEWNKLKDETITILEYKLDNKMKEINDKLNRIIDDEKDENVMSEINKIKQEINKLKRHNDWNGLNNIEPIRKFFETEINLPEYVDVIVENGFDDMESLNDISMEELKELGVKMGHRKKILKCIQQKNIQQNININPSLSEGAGTIFL